MIAQWRFFIAITGRRISRPVAQLLLAVIAGAWLVQANAQLPGVRDDLSVFEESSQTLIIPSLQMGDERLRVTLQLNSEGILIVRDAQPVSGDSLVNAFIDERVGLVTVPVAAISVNGLIAPSRYHLVLKLESTSPQYRLSIHSLEQHRADIVGVSENTRGSMGMQLRHQNGERLSVFGRPAENGIIVRPEAALYQYLNGSAATVLMDNQGRPMTLQTEESLFSFSDHAADRLTLSFRYGDDPQVVRSVKVNRAVSAMLQASSGWPDSPYMQAEMIAQSVSAAVHQAVCAIAEFQQRVATGDIQWAADACHGMMLNMAITQHADPDTISTCTTRAGNCGDIGVSQLESRLNRDVKRLVALTQPPVGGHCVDGNVPHLSVLDLGNAFAVRLDRSRVYSQGYASLLALGNTFQEMYNSQPVSGMVNRDSFRNVLTALASPYALSSVVYSENRETVAATDLFLLPVTRSGLFSVSQINEIRGDLTPTIQFNQDYYGMAVLRTARTVGGDFSIGLAIDGIRAPENTSYQLPTYKSNPSGMMGCISARSNSDYLVIHKSPIQLASGTTNSFIELQATGGSAYWGERVRHLRVNAQPLPAERPALTVRLGGNGQGVIAGSPAGISCGTSCRAEFNLNERVTLNATPGDGSTFTGWGGACSGSDSQCSVNMHQAATVIAYFVNNSAGRDDPYNVRGSVWSLDMNSRLAIEGDDTASCQWRGEMYLYDDLSGYFPPQTLVREDNRSCESGRSRMDFRYRFTESGIEIYDITGSDTSGLGEIELWYVNNNLLQMEQIYDDSSMSEIYTLRATRN